MSVLITADLHFTDRPRDTHRWELLPWLAKQAVKHQVEAVLLLGDLTDSKNNHSAALTNRMVDGLRQLAKVAKVFIIRGNHDYIDEAEPFFGFMDGEPRIQFIKEPTRVDLATGRSLFLPNTRDYQKDWTDLALKGVDYVFCHQTFDGCLTETGFRMEGIPPSVFAKFPGQVYSGDIHKPQKVGRNIEYVGAPYRCRFGDDYKPRVLLLDSDATTKDLHFPTKNKVVLVLRNNTLAEAIVQEEALGDGKLYEGDQIKVRVELPRARYGEWPAIKSEIVQTADAMGLELTGPELIAQEDQLPKGKTSPKGSNLPQGGQTPLAAVEAYAAQHGASPALAKAGAGYLKAAMTLGGK